MPLAAQLERRVEAGKRISKSLLKSEATQDRLEAYHKTIIQRTPLIKLLREAEEELVYLRSKRVGRLRVVEIGAV
eukprot:CAMPEP_0180087562 /NCGR_PEP_ID=MMETSP0985-20121206/21765_1 /TAXON_ID=483367 /ORGANISM="non described non described, Strain CCMP 2436" /LENGTH=74 /DNA_ID=CAMNT_0022021907 /DNA_START=220 /DNA_END=445 /DNA_ORIENTATION=+